MSSRDNGVRTVPRAEHVGSLLRPVKLKALSEKLGAHRPGRSARQRELAPDQYEELRKVEDDAIAEAVRRQIDCGLDVITDGELRRTLFVNSFYDAIDGLRPSEPNRHGRTWKNTRGEQITYPGPAVIERRLSKVASPAAREVAYLRGLTDAPIKVTFPAGSWFVSPLARRDADLPGYQDEEEMQVHALDILRELVREAIAAGAAYVQFDFPPYVLLIDRNARQSLVDAGADPDAMLDRFRWADSYVVAGLPEGVIYGLHLCRGNNQSSWMFEGPLDPVAEQFFDLPYDVFLLEWDDTHRTGGFECLRHLPEHKRVAIGAISTKQPQLEDEDELARRIEEAARHVPLERLALSPQCGFGSTFEGNLLTEDEQWRKLELTGRVANRLWPR